MIAANEYSGPLDGQDTGNADSNPAGVIFELKMSDAPVCSNNSGNVTGNTTGNQTGNETVTTGNETGNITVGNDPCSILLSFTSVQSPVLMNSSIAIQGILVPANGSELSGATVVVNNNTVGVLMNQWSLTMLSPETLGAFQIGRAHV